MTTDTEIMEWYMKGFRDELSGKTEDPKNKLLRRAYITGNSHALLGDDNRSFDYLTNEQILKMIKHG